MLDRGLEAVWPQAPFREALRRPLAPAKFHHEPPLPLSSILEHLDEALWPMVFGWDPATTRPRVERELARLGEIIDRHGIETYFVNMPILTLCLERHDAAYYRAYTEELRTALPGAHFLDLARAIPDEEFHDTAHVTYEGARVASERLADFIARTRAGPRAALVSSLLDSFGAVNLPLAILAGLYALLAAAWLVAGTGARRTRRFQVLALSVSLLLAIALFEAPAVFGKHDYGQTFGTSKSTWIQLSTSVNRPDPELIHVHWPNTRFEGEVLGNLAALGVPDPQRYPVDVRYDRHGFRNERELERAEIAVIGDSFIEAAIVPYESGIAQVLEARTGLVTANLGQSNYGLRQELAVLRRYALPLEPELVLWFFFEGNDLHDVDYYEDSLANLDEMTAPRPLRQRSFVRNAMLALSQRWLARTSDAPAQRALAHSGLLAPSFAGPKRVYFDGGTPQWKAHQWQVAVETLGAAKQLCDEAGAEFALVFIPRKFRVYFDHVAFAEDSAMVGLELNDLPEQLGSWARAQGIRFIDPTPALSAALGEGKHPYIVDDSHWNATGHSIAADTVLSALGGSAGSMLSRIGSP